MTHHTSGRVRTVRPTAARADAFATDELDSLDSETQLRLAAKKYPLLTYEEEIEASQRVKAGLRAEQEKKAREQAGVTVPAHLAEQIQAGQDAQEKLVLHNLRLAFYLARKYASGDTDMDYVDLAIEGLSKAARKYDADANPGVRFSAYAAGWCRARLGKGFPRVAFAQKVPNYLSSYIRRIQKVSGQLAQELGRKPNPQELSEKTGYPLEFVNELIQVSQAPLELDAIVGGREGDGSAELGSFFGETRAEASWREEDALETIDMRREIRDAMSRLSTKEAQVLRLFFGLEGETPLSLKQIGELMGFTPERARQLRAKGLAKLKKLGVLRDLREYF